MILKDAIKKSYNLLPIGCKKKPSEILGVSYKHFTCIVNGNAKKELIYHKALKAIGETAKKHRVNINNQLDQIDTIINQAQNKK